MSLARVFVSQPGEEPWLTLGYDEWIYCCSGRLVFGLPDGSTVELKAGETALVDKGTRFQPRFPEAGTSYIPVCIRAFARTVVCARRGVVLTWRRLAALHTKVEDAPEVLYHMCEQPRWEAAKASGEVYFRSGRSTRRACARDGRAFAPHRDGEPLYRDLTNRGSACAFSRSDLRKKCGIIVRDERAMPVGSKAVARIGLTGSARTSSGASPHRWWTPSSP